MFRKFNVADFAMQGIWFLILAALFGIAAAFSGQNGNMTGVKGFGTMAFILGAMGLIYILKARIDYRAIGDRYANRTDDGLGDPVGDVRSTFDADAAFERYMERQRTEGVTPPVAPLAPVATPMAQAQPIAQPAPPSHPGPRTFGRRTG